MGPYRPSSSPWERSEGGDRVPISTRKFPFSVFWHITKEPNKSILFADAFLRQRLFVKSIDVPWMNDSPDHISNASAREIGTLVPLCYQVFLWSSKSCWCRVKQALETNFRDCVYINIIDSPIYFCCNCCVYLKDTFLSKVRFILREWHCKVAVQWQGINFFDVLREVGTVDDCVQHAADLGIRSP